jgi:molecular chaperone GrpE
MPTDKPRRPIPSETDPLDDIEILEVVGVDENGAPVVEEDAEASEDVELVFEDAAVSDGPPAQPESADASAERRELFERLLRLQADFENFKKRIERERLDHLRHATSDLLARLLPVLDNFERAIAAFRPGGSADAVIEGVGLIHRQLLSELEREGLHGMESLGQPFDPLLHEAVATDPDAPLPPHTVTHVFQRGYFLHDRLLRPAMVRVRVDASDEAAPPDDRKESSDG